MGVGILFGWNIDWSAKRGAGAGASASAAGLDDVFVEDEEDFGPATAAISQPRGKRTSSSTSYPGVVSDGGDPILWFKWDELHDHYHHRNQQRHYNDTHLNDNNTPNTTQTSTNTNTNTNAAHLPRRLLFLGYATGFQIWDCTNLSSVSEILNLSGWSSTVAATSFSSSSAGVGMGMGIKEGLGREGRGEDWERVVFAGVLCPPPSPAPSMKGGDSFAAQRPLIGVW